MEDSYVHCICIILWVVSDAAVWLDNAEVSEIRYETGSSCCVSKFGMVNSPQYTNITVTPTTSSAREDVNNQ